MEMNQQKLNDKLVLARDHQKREYDRFVRSSVVFSPGDLVRLVNERTESGHSKLFRVRALDPFKVVEKFNQNYKTVAFDTNKSPTTIDSALIECV